VAPERVELSRPGGHGHLEAGRLPFRHKTRAGTNGIEPSTSSLTKPCSTSELCPINVTSGPPGIEPGLPLGKLRLRQLRMSGSARGPRSEVAPEGLEPSRSRGAPEPGFGASTFRHGAESGTPPVGTGGLEPPISGSRRRRPATGLRPYTSPYTGEKISPSGRRGTRTPKAERRRVYGATPLPIWIDVQATRRFGSARGPARQEGIEPSTTPVWKPLLCH
jgi:hypothetical protein